MHLDAQNLFSDAQAITATAVSTNHIDLGDTAQPVLSPVKLTRDIGGNYDIPLLVQVVEDFTGGTSVTVQVQMAAANSFASPKSSPPRPRSRSRSSRRASSSRSRSSRRARISATCA